MPKKEQILQDKLQQFHEKYNIEIQDMINDFAALDLPKEQKQERYTAMVSNALVSHIRNVLKMKEGGKYDLSDFSIAEFAEDFEDIVQTKNEANRAPARAAYEGIKLEYLFDSLTEATRDYSYPLAELWAKDFRRGNITVQSMKAITDNAVDMLIGQSPDQKAHKNVLINIVAARRMMEAVRENRSYLWCFFHPIQNYREKNYLKLLNQNTETLQVIGYDVNNVDRMLEDETLSGAYEKLLDHEAYEERFEKEREKDRKALEELAAKGEIYGIVSMVEKKLADKSFKPKLTEALLAALPEGSSNMENTKNVLQGNIDSIIEIAQKANAEYASEIAHATSPKTAMEGYTIDVFRDVLKMTADMNYDLKGRFLAAQKLTDVILDQLSPSAFAKNVLGEFAQGCVFNGCCKFISDSFHYSLELPEKEVNVAFASAKDAYNGVETVRENVVFPPDTFAEQKITYGPTEDPNPPTWEELMEMGKILNFK